MVSRPYEHCDREQAGGRLMVFKTQIVVAATYGAYCCSTTDRKRTSNVEVECDGRFFEACGAIYTAISARWGNGKVVYEAISRSNEIVTLMR
jgi:hypothetical protein